LIRAAVLTLALAAGSAAAQGDPPTPEAGRKAYTSFCARCHGLNLVVSGGAFFDLRRFPADDKARFVTSVSKGLRAMPAWEGIVKPEQVEAIWLYIGSVNGWAGSNQAQ
jgi:mono/diheme cytochrome c family protein